MKQKSTMSKPQMSSSFAQNELDKAEAKFDEFNEEVKSMTLDRMNQTAVEEREPQTKISSRDAQRMKVVVLKPSRSLPSKERFNEKYRKEFEYASQHVLFTAENNEVIGEKIEKWTKEFPGQDCEFWEIPVNTLVEGPRYLAESIKKARYHRLVMQDRTTSSDGMGQYYGAMAVDKTIQRLDAHPVSSDRSIFMGTSGP